jgi:DNA polymerase-1
MTNISQDEAFLEIYSEGLNPHAYTASKISGVPYKEIIEGKETDDRLATIYKAGKITNLGKNYRMGVKTLWTNAHTQWGLTPSLDECNQWNKTWLSTYKGIQIQWANFIDKARHKGYAETLAGRRFYIHEWHRYKWASESSAIMTPIQGSGADMKYLAIAVMRKRFPELTFWGEIHDEIIYTLDIKSIDNLTGDPYRTASRAICCQVKKVLDNLPYEKAWGWKPSVPFTWSVGYGKNWKEINNV